MRQIRLLARSLNISLSHATPRIPVAQSLFVGALPKTHFHDGGGNASLALTLKLYWVSVFRGTVFLFFFVFFSPLSFGQSGRILRFRRKNLTQFSRRTRARSRFIEISASRLRSKDASRDNEGKLTRKIVCNIAQSFVLQARECHACLCYARGFKTGNFSARSDLTQTSRNVIGG